MGKNITTLNDIESSIYLIRGHRVLLDSDLARLYGVSTKTLVQAVKRNHNRFPLDFMYQITLKEVRDLRSQIVTSKAQTAGGRRYLPYVFTEQGIAMLSSVLKSETAIQVNIAIMRAFARFRQMLSTNKELALKLAELERKVEKNDSEIQAIFQAIRQLMISPKKEDVRKIGF